MYLVSHGGACCGIRHIMSLSKQLCYKLPELSEVPEVDGWRKALGHYIAVAYEAREAEMPVERFDGLIKQCVKQFPGGIIEVVLMDYRGKQYPGCDQLDWIPVLEDRGFRFVTRCINSNSNNFIYVFHHVSEQKRDYFPDRNQPSDNTSEPFPWDKYGLTKPDIDPKTGLSRGETK